VFCLSAAAAGDDYVRIVGVSDNYKANVTTILLRSCECLVPRLEGVNEDDKYSKARAAELYSSHSISKIQGGIEKVFLAVDVVKSRTVCSAREQQTMKEK
jgi:hypothetical protein